MTIKAAYSIDDGQIDAMEMEITIKMKVGEWRSLNKALPAVGYEPVGLSRAITQALDDLGRATARRYTYPREEK